MYSNQNMYCLVFSDGLASGSSGETIRYATLPSADGRQAVRIKVGEMTDHRPMRQSYTEGTKDTLQHQAYQAQLPAARHESTYYNSSQPSTSSNITVLDRYHLRFYAFTRLCEVGNMHSGRAFCDSVCACVCLCACL